MSKQEYCIHSYLKVAIIILRNLARLVRYVSVYLQQMFLWENNVIKLHPLTTGTRSVVSGYDNSNKANII